MKRLALLLVLCLLLSGCAGQKQYSAVYLTVFDTVTTVLGYAETETAFRARAQTIYDELERYHQLFDIYHDYDVPNLKTVNDNAGIAPVTVDRAIIELLLDCRAYYDLTNGTVNAAMGSVLRLWHEARSTQPARLPDSAALEEAARHTDFDAVLIDGEACTVFITDPAMSLDVGAVAKGWVCQRVAANAPEGWLISLGGNVCATGAKPDGKPWVVGIEDPEGDGYLRTLSLTKGSAVTSGDYQRTYTVDGTAYHHIIDPATAMPARGFRSVTVVCGDSALADALSTALFILPREAGQALAEACGAQALWLDTAGTLYTTPGFPTN